MSGAGILGLRPRDTLQGFQSWKGMGGWFAKTDSSAKAEHRVAAVIWDVLWERAAIGVPIEDFDVSCERKSRM